MDMSAGALTMHPFVLQAVKEALSGPLSQQLPLRLIEKSSFEILGLAMCLSLHPPFSASPSSPAGAKSVYRTVC
jgi:hypothetical protein